MAPQAAGVVVVGHELTEVVAKHGGAAGLEADEVHALGEVAAELVQGPAQLTSSRTEQADGVMGSPQQICRSGMSTR